jgi:hypothetical protein
MLLLGCMTASAVMTWICLNFYKTNAADERTEHNAKAELEAEDQPEANRNENTYREAARSFLMEADNCVLESKLQLNVHTYNDRRASLKKAWENVPVRPPARFANVHQTMSLIYDHLNMTTWTPVFVQITLGLTRAESGLDAGEKENQRYRDKMWNLKPFIDKALLQIP